MNIAVLKYGIELIGALAVLVGLVFVGFELRQNTAAVQAASSQGLLEQSNSSNFEIAANAELAALISKGDASLEVLNDAEELQYQSYIHGEINIWEQAFYGHLGGTLSDRIWHGYDSGYTEFLCDRESRRVVWRKIENYFGVEFREYISGNALLRCAERDQ